jgi:hypothetical protein
MSKRVLDTNQLIGQFRLLQPYSRKKKDDAIRCADQLIELHESNAIVSPVEIEVIGGVVDPHEMELTIAFLGQFQVIDKRRIQPEDWEEARRIAKHIGKNAKRRDLGDCLFTAISNRLHHEVLTDDSGLKRQVGRTRQRGS